MQTLEDGKMVLTYEEAVRFLPKRKRVHTFMEGGFALVGADWDRQSVLDLLKKADGRPDPKDRIEATGPAAQGMGHGLAVWRTPGNGASVIFIETTKRTDGVHA